MMLNRRLVFAAGAAAIAASVYVASLPKPSTVPAATQASSPMTLIVGGPSDLALLLVVARDKGLFKEANVNVDYRPLQTGKIAQDALLSSDLDVAVIVETNIAFIGFQKNPKVKVLASVQEQTGDGIVARKDRGIAKAADLKGKTIGYLPATTSHVFIDRYLKRNGMSLDDVKLLAMPPPALQSAVTRGDVDAVSVFQPFRFNAAQELKGNGIEFTDRAAYVAHALLATREDVVAKKEDALRRMIGALIKAEGLLAADKASFFEPVAKEIGITTDAMKAQWDDYRMRVRFDETLRKTVAEEGEWIRSSQDGFKGNPQPDYDQYFYPALLRAIKPDAVTVSLK